MRESKHDVAAIYRRKADINLAGDVLNDFLKAYGSSGVQADSVKHVEAHLRWILPADAVRLASSVTSEWLALQLVAYTAAPRSKAKSAERVAITPNARRKEHSSWSTFFAYCTKVRRLYAANPMGAVDRPTLQRPPIKFYEPDEVKAIVERVAARAMRVLIALMYGTGIEVSVALRLTRRDVNERTHEVHAAGTKAVGRDRMCLIAKWARPLVEAYCKDKMPGALLFPGLSRWDALNAHRDSAAAANLRVIPLRNSRHAWAVRAVRAGTPLAVVAAQLGHGSVQLAANTYGRFVPTAVERSRWERRAAADDRAREKEREARAESR